MRLWFGDFDGKNVKLAGHTIEALAAWVESSDSKESNRVVNLESLAMESGLCASPGDYRRLIHETAMQVARNRIARSLASKDAYLVQAVRTLDDLSGSFNIISERLAEWYGIYYPEKRMRPNELLDHILQHGTGGAPATIGAPMDSEDIAMVQGLALMAKAVFYQRKALEGYVNSAMDEIAPNLSRVLGPVLGARLIARAGSLDKLARMPASSIQVMGAGEALFRHLKAGTPSPKHGLIYKHPLISGAPKNARGKISRMLAGKAAIAARMDHYSGEMMDFGDLKEKAAKIKVRSAGRKKP